MLGHAELTTSQIYTQISLRKLRAIHAATHPGATNARHRSPAVGEDDERDEVAGVRLASLDDETAAEAAEAPAGDEQGSNPPPCSATLRPR